MRKLAFLLIALTAFSGCNTVSKHKGVSIESDGSGKTIRRVESEAVTQTMSSNKKLELKHIQY